MKHIMTIDLEDWFHSFLTIPASQRQHYKPRAHIGTLKLLRLFSEHKIRATFFVLGAVAEQSPDLIRRIAAEGHEIACHGYSHIPVYLQSHAEFQDDVVRSVEILQRLTNQIIAGFRAPWWSITKSSMWALDVLANLGFHYDSSIFPVNMGYYGVAGAPFAIHKLPLANNNCLWEVPPLTYKLFGVRMPVGGGFYLRTLPYSYNALAIQKATQAMIYLHPWELDPAQPRIKVSPLQHFIHYTAIDRMESKLHRLLDEFDFTSINEVLSETQ